jgi:hypothetical protein
MYQFTFDLHPSHMPQMPCTLELYRFRHPMSYTNHPEYPTMHLCPISQSRLSPSQPWVRQNFHDGDPFIHISIQHLADQIDAPFGKWEERYSQRVIQNFVDVVEWVLLVDDRVEQNTESPHILLFSAIGFALKHLGRCVVWS